MSISILQSIWTLTVKPDSQLTGTTSFSPDIHKLQLGVLFHLKFFATPTWEYIQRLLLKVSNDVFNNKWPKMLEKAYRLCSGHCWQSTILWYKSHLCNKQNMKKHLIDCRQFENLDQKGIDFSPVSCQQYSTETGGKDPINSFHRNIPPVVLVLQKYS